MLLLRLREEQRDHVLLSTDEDRQVARDRRRQRTARPRGRGRRKRECTQAELERGGKGAARARADRHATGIVAAQILACPSFSRPEI